MHQVLDRQLQLVNGVKGKVKRDRTDYRFISDLDDNKKSTLSNISNKPVIYQHEVKDIHITNKQNQITELEKRLMELEKKM